MITDVSSLYLIDSQLLATVKAGIIEKHYLYLQYLNGLSKSSFVIT